MRPTLLDPTLVRHYGTEGGRHAHDHAQVLFGLSGTLQMEVQGHSAWVDATCGLVIPAGTTHAYCAEQAARVLVLDCPAGPATDRLRAFALAPGWQALAPGREHLLDALARAPTLAPRRRIDLDTLADRINADLARRWAVADLAAACCLSPQRLRARFAQALEAVALQVGYGSASALSAALRRERDTGALALRTRRAFRAS